GHAVCLYPCHRRPHVPQLWGRPESGWRGRRQESVRPAQLPEGSAGEHEREGEHWPSDGLAAVLFGGFWLALGIQVYFWAARRWPRLVPGNERPARQEAPRAA